MLFLTLMRNFSILGKDFSSNQMKSQQSQIFAEQQIYFYQIFSYSYFICKNRIDNKFRIQKQLLQQKHSMTDTPPQNQIKYKKERQSFLSGTLKVQLPSNLLSIVSKRQNQQTRSTNISRYKYSNTNPICDDQAFNTIKYEECPLEIKDYKFETMNQSQDFTEKFQAGRKKQKFSKSHYPNSSSEKNRDAKFFRTQSRDGEWDHIEKQRQFTIDEGKSNKNKKKMSLYKKLSEVRSHTEQLKTMSLSKMLSQMVVIQDDDNTIEPIKLPVQTKQSINRKPYYVPVSQKTYELRCHTVDHRNNFKTKVAQASQRDPKYDTKRIFNRFFVPPSTSHSSKLEKVILNQETDPTGRYVYKNKKVQCRRIHNFYTTDKFKKNYANYIKKTLTNLQTD